MDHGEPVLFNTPAGIICAQQFGAAGGRPLFHFHGQMSSRLEALYLQQAAVELGIRMVALDRPGFGDSPPNIHSSLRHWPTAVASIADQLGIERFAVIGVSAGAKFALATVLGVRERISCAVLASSFGELSEPEAIGAATFRVRWAVGLYRYAPAVGDGASGAASFFMRHGIETILRAGRYLAPPTERRVLADPDVLRIAAQVLRASASQGSAGIAKEFRAIVAPWNLALDEIRVPVAMWHGESDVVAPIAMAQVLANRIPGAQLHRAANAGHVSLLVNHSREILMSSI